MTQLTTRPLFLLNQKQVRAGLGSASASDFPLQFDVPFVSEYQRLSLREPFSVLKRPSEVLPLGLYSARARG